MIIFILVFLFRITYNNSYETSLAMIIIIGLIDVITTFFSRAIWRYAAPGNYTNYTSAAAFIPSACGDKWTENAK